MKKLIRELFFLRRGERRALYVVMLLLVSSGLVRIYISTRPLPAFQPDEVFTWHMEQIRKQIDSVTKQEHALEQYAAQQGSKRNWWTAQQGKQDTKQGSLDPAPFDPNTVSYETLLAMNLSSYVSSNIISYRDAGGVFRKPSDLEKIYGLEQEMYTALLPYIAIAGNDVEQGAGNVPESYVSAKYTHKQPATRHGNTGTHQSDTGIHQDTSSAHHAIAGSRPDGSLTRYENYRTWSDTLFPLELNSVDSAELIALPGIGPWFAGRIIRYRELLGGFVNPVQLLEVYGMDTVRYNGMVSLVIADSMNIQRIDLNNSTFREVISHPYINREETYAIFRYLDFVDSISHPENILRDQIIDRDRFMRMAPYLTVRGSVE